MNQRYLMLFSIIALTPFFISDAYAYIDPGTGSAIIPMIISAFVGLGIAIKLYWEKLKYKFVKRE